MTISSLDGRVLRAGLILALVVALAAAAGCSRTQRTVGGAAIGGASGAVIGNAVGDGTGAVIGGLGGAAAGGYIGRNY